ncbi:SCP2 sterol-binding domain-containing protein [Micromonospora sp. NPDC048830]|uniref:SCP2 sterol-binding domain-containing protein n=1 Tax=Micromonospora sp. NPDC048830 TaxID=3364257 RepID=UPI003712A9CA
MQKQIEEFFSDLADRGHIPRLGRINAVVRIDITDDARRESRFVTVKAGDVTVSREGPSPNAVLTASEGVFARLISSGEGWYALLLRGDLLTEGDIYVLSYLAYVIFPGRPGDLGPHEWQERKRRCPKR